MFIIEKKGKRIDECFLRGGRYGRSLISRTISRTVRKL
ncbi:hypothetical protein FH5_04550 [Priestia endophytica]|nr:hypothetical protein FH5_04550 [Priestia endophytica]